MRYWWWQVLNAIRLTIAAAIYAMEMIGLFVATCALVDRGQTAIANRRRGTSWRDAITWALKHQNKLDPDDAGYLSLDALKRFKPSSPYGWSCRTILMRMCLPNIGNVMYPRWSSSKTIWIGSKRVDRDWMGRSWWKVIWIGSSKLYMSWTMMRSQRTQKIVGLKVQFAWTSHERGITFAQLQEYLEPPENEADDVARCLSSGTSADSLSKGSPSSVKQGGNGKYTTANGGIATDGEFIRSVSPSASGHSDLNYQTQSGQNNERSTKMSTPGIEALLEKTRAGFARVTLRAARWEQGSQADETKKSRWLKWKIREVDLAIQLSVLLIRALIADAALALSGLPDDILEEYRSFLPKHRQFLDAMAAEVIHLTSLRADRREWCGRLAEWQAQRKPPASAESTMAELAGNAAGDLQTASEVTGTQATVPTATPLGVDEQGASAEAVTGGTPLSCNGLTPVKAET